MMVQTNILFPLIVVLFLQGYHSFKVRCPKGVEWYLKSKSKCHKQDKPNYICLFDGNENIYNEFCSEIPEETDRGNKLVILGGVTGDRCSDERFQPFIFSTDRLNDCAYLKSTCGGHGQLQSNSSSTTSDTKCQCNQRRGYFPVTKSNTCDCNPFIEDCSCFQSFCNETDTDCRIEIKKMQNKSLCMIVTQEHWHDDQSKIRTNVTRLDIPAFNVCLQKKRAYRTITAVLTTVFLSLIIIAMLILVIVNPDNNPQMENGKSVLLEVFTHGNLKNKPSMVGSFPVQGDNTEDSFEPDAILRGRDVKPEVPKTVIKQKKIQRSVSAPSINRTYPKTQLKSVLEDPINLEDQQINFDGKRFGKIRKDEIRSRLKDLYTIRFNEAQSCLTEANSNRLGKEPEDQLNIVLVGKTGSGKSSTANMICGKSWFPVDDNGKFQSRAVTIRCNDKSAKVFNRNIVLIDTPGIFGADTDQESVKKEIDKCFLLAAPKIHVVLFVIPVQRYTQEDITSINVFLEYFKPDMRDHILTVFTHSDRLKKQSFEDFTDRLGGSLREFLDKSDKRYLPFNNTLPFEGHQRESQVQCLMEMIDRSILQGKMKFYTDESLNKAEKIIQEEAERIKQNEKTKYETIMDTLYAKAKQKLEELERTIESNDEDIDQHFFLEDFKSTIEDFRKSCQQEGLDFIKKLESLRDEIRQKLSLSEEQDDLVVKLFDRFKANLILKCNN